MAAVSQIITDLISAYKDDAASGVIIAQGKINELLSEVDEERVVFSSIEGNQFKWEDHGMSNADWLTVWIGVKRGLEDSVSGKPARTGVFSMKFNRLCP